MAIDPAREPQRSSLDPQAVWRERQETSRSWNASVRRGSASATRRQPSRPSTARATCTPRSWPSRRPSARSRRAPSGSRTTRSRDGRAHASCPPRVTRGSDPDAGGVRAGPRLELLGRRSAAHGRLWPHPPQGAARRDVRRGGARLRPGRQRGRAIAALLASLGQASRAAWTRRPRGQRSSGRSPTDRTKKSRSSIRCGASCLPTSGRFGSASRTWSFNASTRWFAALMLLPTLTGEPTN